MGLNPLCNAACHDGTESGHMITREIQKTQNQKDNLGEFNSPPLCHAACHELCHDGAGNVLHMWDDHLQGEQVGGQPEQDGQARVGPEDG